MKLYETVAAAEKAMHNDYKPSDPVCIVGTTDGKFLIANLFAAIAISAKIFAEN